MEFLVCNYAHPILVLLLENLVKREQEFFVLHQLEVKDAFFEHLV